MTGFGFLILFGLNCLLIPSEGYVYSPSNGTRLTFVTGSTARIVWSFDDSIQRSSQRVWFYFGDGKLAEGVTLARIYGDGDIVKETSLFQFEVEKPATLVLKNVNQTYNGSYQFNLIGRGASQIVVFIAVTPIVTVNCSSLVIANQSDYFACQCKGQDGNPPAGVTWFKDNSQIVTGIEEQILRLPNVNKNDSGAYRCEAKSHKKAKNETSIELIVNYPPEEPYFNEKGVVGKTFAITCESNGRPSPRYTIVHNDTKVVSNDKTYTIDVVQYSHAGLYKCIAENKLGTSSKIYHLSIIDQSIIPTIGTTTNNFSTTENSRPANTAANGTTVVVWHIVVTLVAGIIIGILLSYIALCSHRRWFRNRKPERNPEAETTEIDTTYQELDRTKMNTEDNYQSLRMTDASNAAANDEDSTGYTDVKGSGPEVEVYIIE